jgi:hypothetical protein
MTIVAYCLSVVFFLPIGHDAKLRLASLRHVRASAYREAERWVSLEWALLPLNFPACSYHTMNFEKRKILVFKITEVTHL